MGHGVQRDTLVVGKVTYLKYAPKKKHLTSVFLGQSKDQYLDLLKSY